MNWTDFDNPREEREYLVKAFWNDRKNPKHCFRLALVYEYLNYLTFAMRYGKMAVKLDPDNTDHLEFMAFVCRRAGEMYQAVFYWKKLLEIDPKNDHYRNELEVLREFDIN